MQSAPSGPRKTLGAVVTSGRRLVMFQNIFIARDPLRGGAWEGDGLWRSWARPTRSGHRVPLSVRRGTLGYLRYTHVIDP